MTATKRFLLSIRTLRSRKWEITILTHRYTWIHSIQACCRLRFIRWNIDVPNFQCYDRLFRVLMLPFQKMNRHFQLMKLVQISKPNECSNNDDILINIGADGHLGVNIMLSILSTFSPCICRDWVHGKSNDSVTRHIRLTIVSAICTRLKWVNIIHFGEREQIRIQKWK